MPPDNKITEVCRKHGMADKTYYQWRKRYGGVDNASALRELKPLRNENVRLKKLSATNNGLTRQSTTIKVA